MRPMRPSTAGSEAGGSPEEAPRSAMFLLRAPDDDSHGIRLTSQANYLPPIR